MSVSFLWASPSSQVTFGFWKALAEKKVKEWRLDSSPRPVLGFLKAGTCPIVEVRGQAFAPASSIIAADDPEGLQPGEQVLLGEIIVCNTAEAFKALDKNALMRQAACKHWRALQAQVKGERVDGPPAFLMIVFADLKEHRHVFWFGFPSAVALLPSPSGPSIEATELVGIEVLESRSGASIPGPLLLSSEGESGSLVDLISVRQSRDDVVSTSLHQWAASVASASQNRGQAAARVASALFIVPDGLRPSDPASTALSPHGIAPVTAGWFLRSQLHCIVAAIQRALDVSNNTANEGLEDNALECVRFELCIARGNFEAAGASTASSSCLLLSVEVDLTQGTPWAPRNESSSARHERQALPLLPTSPSYSSVATVSSPASYSFSSPTASASATSSSSSMEVPSPTFTGVIRPVGGAAAEVAIAGEATEAPASGSASLWSTPEVPPEKPSPESSQRGYTCIGWELNQKGQPAPKVANLRSAMVPSELSESAAQLNLDLMRWRMLPQLQLAAISSLRCLLLGAGTLGCHVARDLLAWGVRHITFVDSGRVSYSNPVRQPLFEFADAAAEGGSGRLKAQAAAEALKRIHPKVNSLWKNLRIPMPGHPVVGSSAGAEAEVRELEALIAGHDVVFLLTDTRESRWLPTLLASAMGKLAVTVALGFDSFLTMRHGVRPSSAAGDSTAHARLGCYYCSDVVSPTDSTQNRTLDQQCTVTRPGVAPLSSALAVELLMALLHHPARFQAPADAATPMSSPSASPLGLVPHQLRGFLSHTHVMMATIPAFEQCPACSDAVVAEYRLGGYAFLEQVFNDVGGSSTTSAAAGAGAGAGGSAVGVLDRVTGLDKLKLETEEKLRRAALEMGPRRAAEKHDAGSPKDVEGEGSGEEDYADLLEEWVLGNE